MSPTWEEHCRKKKLRLEASDSFDDLFEVCPDLNQKVFLRWANFKERLNEDVTITDEINVKDLDVGEAKLETGNDSCIIKARGSNRNNGIEEQTCYENIFDCVLNNKFRSIVFLGIKNGMFKDDPNDAVDIAVCETRLFLRDHADKVDRISFVVENDEELKIYEKFLQIYFPVEEKSQPEIPELSDEFRRILGLGDGQILEQYISRNQEIKC